MSNENRLEVDSETMRRLGYGVVDLLVDRIAGLDARPAWRAGDRGTLERVLREPPPEHAEPFDTLIDRLRDDVLPHAASVDHPRFLGFVPGSPTWPGILGDFIASGYNIFEGSWLGGSGASAIELVVLDWFKEWLGYPAGAAGLFTSGGSAANLTAIACARQLRFGGHDANAVLYFSSESHSSVERAARILGFRPERMRRIPVDASQRLEPDAVNRRIEADVRDGLSPFLVVASAGTTSTGAVDPLHPLADVAARHGCWLHVDAAYGGFAVLTARGRTVMEGIERADSITLDPHKWLFQPFEAGCLLVRRGRDLESAFHVMPDYLQDAAVQGEDERTRPVNFMDRGIQLTRSARALKVWLSLKYFGVAAFRGAIDEAIDLAVHAEHRLRESGRFEILSPARFGIVCFRRIRQSGPSLGPDADAWNAALIRNLADSGEALISSTRVNGEFALRFCILSHRTRRADIDRVIAWLECQPEPDVGAAV